MKPLEIIGILTIGILAGSLLTRFFLNSLLQKNELYIQKEKYLKNELRKKGDVCRI